jgi:pyroglutamyl-peptidase
MLTRTTRTANSARPRKSAASTAPRTVLLTGFDAFGGETVNPSWLAVQSLHGKRILGRKLVAAQLPTVFDASLPQLRQLLDKHRPELVICVGQAGGRSAISLERVAINVNDARIADNAGATPIDAPVVAGGPAAYFSTLPIKAMLRDLLARGIAAEVSQTAGTFVCNHVFYGLMHLLATRANLKAARGGFVHLPYLPEQLTSEMKSQNVPNMSLMDMVWGLKFAVRCALDHPMDVALGAGATQ